MIADLKGYVFTKESSRGNKDTDKLRRCAATDEHQLDSSPLSTRLIISVKVFLYNPLSKYHPR